MQINILKMIQKNRRLQCMAFAFLMTAVCGIFGAFQMLYLNVDNYLMALVTNKVYDTDNYCMFINPVLCWIVGGMQKLLPASDSFTLLSRIMILVGVWCLSYFIAKIAYKKSEMICAYLILFLLVVNASLFFDYFTIWASFFSCVGMVMLMSSLQDGSWKRTIAGTIFVSCGILWRIESALMFVPFFFLEIAVEFLFCIKGKKERIKWGKRACKILGPMVLCAVLLFGIDYGYKYSEMYIGGVKYNNALSSVVDFPMESYEEIKELLPGISENDYNSLRDHFYMDTDRIDAEYAQRIADAGAVKTSNIDVSGFYEVSSLLLDTVLASKKTIFYLVLLFLLLLCMVLSDAKWYYKLELFLAYGGAYLIMFFFAYIGRVPLRIINSAIYGSFGIALILYSKERWEKGRTYIKWIKYAISIFVLLVVCQDTLSYDFVRPQSLFQVKRGADEGKWESTYKDDEIYIWKTTEFVLYPMNDFIKQGKFMSEEFLEHNLSCGDWTHGQVYYQNYLKRLGIDNPMEALLKRENTYYVASDAKTVLIYLQEHYEEDVKVQQVDEIDGIPVWEFKIQKEKYQ